MDFQAQLMALLMQGVSGGAERPLPVSQNVGWNQTPTPTPNQNQNQNFNLGFNQTQIPPSPFGSFPSQTPFIQNQAPQTFQQQQPQQQLHMQDPRAFAQPAPHFHQPQFYPSAPQFEAVQHPQSDPRKLSHVGQQQQHQQHQVQNNSQRRQFESDNRSWAGQQQTQTVETTKKKSKKDKKKKKNKKDRKVEDTPSVQEDPDAMSDIDGVAISPRSLEKENKKRELALREEEQDQEDQHQEQQQEEDQHQEEDQESRKKKKHKKKRQQEQEEEVQEVVQVQEEGEDEEEEELRKERKRKRREKREQRRKEREERKKRLMEEEEHSDNDQNLVTEEPEPEVEEERPKHKKNKKNKKTVPESPEISPEEVDVEPSQNNNAVPVPHFDYHPQASQTMEQEEEEEEEEENYDGEEIDGDEITSNVSGSKKVLPFIANNERSDRQNMISFLRHQFQRPLLDFDWSSLSLDPDALQEATRSLKHDLSPLGLSVSLESFTKLQNAASQELVKKMTPKTVFYHCVEISKAGVPSQQKNFHLCVLKVSVDYESIKFTGPFLVICTLVESNIFGSPDAKQALAAAASQHLAIIYARQKLKHIQSIFFVQEYPVLIRESRFYFPLTSGILSQYPDLEKAIRLVPPPSPSRATFSIKVFRDWIKEVGLSLRLRRTSEVVEKSIGKRAVKFTCTIFINDIKFYKYKNFSEDVVISWCILSAAVIFSCLYNECIDADVDSFTRTHFSNSDVKITTSTDETSLSLNDSIFRHSDTLEARASVEETVEDLAFAALAKAPSPPPYSHNLSDPWNTLVQWCKDNGLSCSESFSPDKETNLVCDIKLGGRVFFSSSQLSYVPLDILKDKTKILNSTASGALLRLLQLYMNLNAVQAKKSWLKEQDTFPCVESRTDEFKFINVPLPAGYVLESQATPGCKEKVVTVAQAQKLYDAVLMERMVEINKYTEKYLNAFLNSGGGNLYIGISDNGRIVGVPFSHTTVDKILLSLQNRLMISWEVPVDPKLYRFELIPVLSSSDLANGVHYKILSEQAKSSSSSSADSQQLVLPPAGCKSVLHMEVKAGIHSIYRMNIQGQLKAYWRPGASNEVIPADITNQRLALLPKNAIRQTRAVATFKDDIPLLKKKKTIVPPKSQSSQPQQQQQQQQQRNPNQFYSQRINVQGQQQQFAQAIPFPSLAMAAPPPPPSSTLPFPSSFGFNSDPMAQQQFQQQPQFQQHQPQPFYPGFQQQQQQQPQDGFFPQQQNPNEPPFKRPRYM